MEKQITITQNNKGGINFKVEGFSAIETLGILRFQEKRIWIEMMEQSMDRLKPKKNDIESAESTNENS